MSFAAFERRWIVAILGSFTAPEGEFIVREGEVDYVTSAEVMAGGSNAKARLGLHVAVWLAALAPAWMLGRPETIDEVPAATRTEILTRMVAHRVFLVRGLATLLKLAATLAMMRSPEVRARSHYDRRALEPQPARRALPLVAHQG